MAKNKIAPVKKTVKREIVKKETGTALEITQTLQPLPSSKALELRKIFEPLIAGLATFEAEVITVKSLPQSPDKSAKAKRLRLDIGKVRVKAEKIRKTQKAEILRAGKAIDGVNNILKFAVMKTEEELKEIEDFYKRQQEALVTKLIEQRLEQLSKYTDDEYDDLGSMTVDGFKTLLVTVKTEYKAQKDLEKKQRQAEKAALAEQKRIKAENATLQAAQNEKDAEIEKLQLEKAKLAIKVKEHKTEKTIETKKKKTALAKVTNLEPYDILQQWLDKWEDALTGGAYEDFCDDIMFLAQSWSVNNDK